MTYSSGGLIQASDYNGFIQNNGGANLNTVWSTGSGDSGWGQSALSTVTGGSDTVTATQWAGLVNNLAAAGNHTGSSLTSRTAPTTGDTVGILSALNTDLSTITSNRGNAHAAGTINNTWSGSSAKTSSTGAASGGWTITWTHTVTFPSADQARYFFNAGGLIRIDMDKQSTGTDKDPDWNTFASNQGTFYLSGRVAGSSQVIGGTTYTGFTRSGGSGSGSTHASTTGWYSLSAGAGATTMWKQLSSTSPYTSDFIQITCSKNAGSTELTFTTTWSDAGYSGAGTSNNISGGTDTASPFSSFGTAPAVVVRWQAPSTTYLSASWGTPTVSASVS